MESVGFIDSEVDVESDATTRGTWGKQIEFTLSCVGYSVGLGNLWRFPYLCMRNGGGAFLIPYFTFLVLCGIPLFFLELCIGQFSSLSPLSAWRLCPLFKGIGWCMIVISTIISIYYNVIIAWVLYYLGMSFASDVPWRHCDNEWNTENCTVVGEHDVNNTILNGSLLADDHHSGSGVITGRMTAAEEFWSYKVLGISGGIQEPGPVKWDLLLSLLAAWVLIFLCLCKGVKSSGKVVYVTAILPYALLVVLLVRGVTLPGSLEGIKFYIIPDWSKLKEVTVWTDACMQIFFSLGPTWGGLITMASYNKFHHNCQRDAILVSFTCAGSSMFGGFAIFSILGYMAHATGQSVEDVVTQGPGLAFVAYPEATAKLPVSPVWAILFFLTLLTVGIDGQFGTLETVTSGFIDEFPRFLNKRKTVFVIAVCIVMFLTAIPFVTRGGMYLFQIVDWYSAAFSTMVIGLSECIVVCYLYGVGRFYRDITFMLNRRPSVIWAVSWCGVIPVLLVVMLVMSAVRMTPPTYGQYEYPTWGIALGWVIAMSSIVPLPLVAVYRVIKAKGSFKQRLQTLIRPKANWGPKEKQSKTGLDYDAGDYTWRQRMNIYYVPNNTLANVNVVLNDKTQV